MAELSASEFETQGPLDPDGGMDRQYGHGADSTGGAILAERQPLYLISPEVILDGVTS
jgi:hypothetical protein